MILRSVVAENWKMDGGVAFGVVPKTIWKKLIEPDENNLIKITSRSILIESGDRIILVDTGMGRKQNDKYYRFRYLFGEESLETSLKNIGYTCDEITDVIFTHLHDDHCGGAVESDDQGNYELTFKNAIYHCSKDQWKWANNPNKRESGSFFKENFIPVEKAGKLNLIENEGDFIDNIQLRIFHGHTQGLVVPVIKMQNKIFVYVTDFIPTAAHIPVPYIASVDIQPLIALKEKEKFLAEAVDMAYYLIFEHDYKIECCTVKLTDKGVRIDETFRLNEILS